jgi:hypothetical protein
MDRVVWEFISWQTSADGIIGFSTVSPTPSNQKDAGTQFASAAFF